MTGVAAAANTVLAGRYRLVSAVRSGPRTTLWRGVDETLARPVAVRTLDDPDAVAPAAFLEAARVAGRLAHPRIASTYDAATEDGVSYVVAEWVEGRPLATLLADGPLTAPRATTLTAQVAEAVAYAHAQGVEHGDLDTSNVLVCADGAIKVTDFRVAGTVAGTQARDDTESLGRLLYACLTARSPDGVDPGLPVAPRRPDGRLCSPRQVRAGIPRELDAVVNRVLVPDRAGKAGPITSPGLLVAALAPLPGEGGGPGARTLPPDVVRDRKPVSRWVRIGVPALAVLGVGGLSLALGLAVGEVPPPAVQFPSLGPGSQAPNQPTPVTVKPVAARDFDPDGDGTENRTAVQLAYDNDPSTSWETSKYRNNPSFGGLKPGVGLVFDLGAPVALSRVDLAFPVEGVSVELRAAAADGETVEAFPVVAGAQDAKRTVRLTPRPGTRARYWVVWITRLVRADDGRFQAGVAEVVFLR